MYSLKVDYKINSQGRTFLMVFKLRNNSKSEKNAQTEGTIILQTENGISCKVRWLYENSKQNKF